MAETAQDVIEEIRSLRGGSLEGDHLDTRAARWVERLLLGVPHLGRLVSKGVAYRRVMKAELEALIDTLDKARAAGGVYTYAAVQQRLRNAMANADKAMQKE